MYIIKYTKNPEKMSNIFRGKYWNKGAGKLTDDNPGFALPVVPLEPESKPEPVTPKKQEYDYYEYKVRDGKLVLYGIIRREINQFELRKNGGNNDTNEQ